MERKEYDDKLSQIKNEFDIKKKNLQFQYGMAQAIYKTGDLITCHHTETTIEVERIKVGVDMSGIPYPYYVGHEVKKDMTRKKNNSIGSIYGNDDTEKLGEAPTVKEIEKITP
jgi:hypothetical protein